MLFRNPTHTAAYAISGGQIQYPGTTVISPSVQPTAPTNAAYAAAQPTIDGTAVLAAPESTAIPAATIQYALPAQFATHHQLQYQPIEFTASAPAPVPVSIGHNQQFYHFASPIDVFHSLAAHKHPTSLLDSYIPSSVILAAQRQRGASLSHAGRSAHHVPTALFQPAATHPTAFYHQGSHQPGYNTIAYSTAQGYSKRSPKLVTDRPLKLNKIN